MSDWQPIDTAPKDGTAILLFEPMSDLQLAQGFKYGAEVGDMLCIGVGKWLRPDMDEPYWADALDSTLLMDEPTHWMPLPEPPTPSEPPQSPA